MDVSIDKIEGGIIMSQAWKKELVKTYLQMTEGYEGPLLIDWMVDYVEPGSEVLELGMGPGTDMEELKKTYRVTGSDVSPDFLYRYRAFHPHAELVHLDAVTMETNKRFDCICSNKVLVHLTREELEKSLKEQARCLLPNGVLLHTFWRGSGQEVHEGILFTSYEMDDLRTIFESLYEIIKIEEYREEEDGDSILVVVKKRG